MHQPIVDAATQLADRHPTIELVYLCGSRVDGNVGPMSEDCAGLLVLS